MEKNLSNSHAKLVSLNLVTANAKRLSEFYRDVLGGVLVEEHGGPQRIEIWFGPKDDRTVCIVANQQEGYVPPAYSVCQGFEFRVDDADAEYGRIKSLGVEIAGAPKDLPWGFRYFSIKDPDGNGIDLVAAL